MRQLPAEPGLHAPGGEALRTREQKSVFKATPRASGGRNLEPAPPPPLRAAGVGGSRETPGQQVDSSSPDPDNWGMQGALSSPSRDYRVAEEVGAGEGAKEGVPRPARPGVPVLEMGKPIPGHGNGPQPGLE